MNFSEPFLDRYFKVTFISSSENRQSFFYGFAEQLFQNFQKITIKKQRDRVYICYVAGLRSFLGNFLEFPEQLISRAIVIDCF